jgi:hypothetical protein
MTPRYDWPMMPRGERGRARLRRAFNESRAAGADAGPEVAPAEPALSEPTPSEPLAAPAARRSTETPRTRALAAPAVPGRVWLPLGPSGTLRGSVDADPRVAGRVRDVAVSADGRRLYAASALGGLWYSANAGGTWEPVGQFAVTPVANVAASSTTLACGAVHVRFDPGGDIAQDEVWLGTGEPDPAVQPTDRTTRGTYGGVGVLHARGPVATVRANPNADPWTREAQPSPPDPGLRGAGVFSLVEDPATVGQPGVGALVAATTRGLQVRTPGVAGEPWSLVTVAAWEAPNGPGSALAVVTDVVWVRTGAGDRLWVVVAGANVDQRIRGLWRSDNGVAGPFVRVPLPGSATVAGRTRLRRLALAAAPSNQAIVYVLGNGPRLWRVDGDATIRRAALVPGQLFGGDPGQSEYDMAIAVDPANSEQIMLGGSVVTSAIDNTSFAAALYRFSLRLPAPAPAGQWTTTYTGGNQFDRSWVGAEVHADVHRIRWVRPAAAAAGEVLVCCDGGIWRSTADGAPLSFSSRAAGLGVTEPTYLASHPTQPGLVIVGVQDNGTQLRIGESVWQQLFRSGDGGGVAFDPGASERLIAQAIQAQWQDQTGRINNPTWRTGVNAAHATETNATRMYSNAAVLRRADGVTQLAVGTNRIWYSEQWLRTFLGPAPAVGVWAFTVLAVTLPSRTDPRAGDAPDTATDVLPAGPMPAGTLDPLASGIRVLRWAEWPQADPALPHNIRLYALMWGAVHRLDRNPNNGRYTRTQIYRRPVAPPVPGAAAGPNLPSAGSLNDLAVHQPAAGPHGSFYLATANPIEPIWWFDGTGTWHPCTLGAPPPAGLGVTATGYAVTVDPAHPEIVYAGTSIGVFRGTLALGGGGPTWNWVPFTNGLPEAAVQDLELVTYPTPDGAGTIRLLRAAVQSRGVWEVDPDADLVPLTYLRAHPYDTRRLLPTPMADPQRGRAAVDAEWHLDWADARGRDFRAGPAGPAPHPDGTPVGTFSWHAGPDIRIRPAPGSAPPGAPMTAAAPWTARPVDRYQLWSLQTALHAIDPRIVPDGRWTGTFRRRLRTIRTARGMSDQARVDVGLWGHADVQAGFWADPWADGGPTELDLVERVVGQATPRPGGPMAAAVSPASVAIRAGRARVEVCVHHRGAAALPAASVAVLLLTLPLPADPATWPLLPGIALTAVTPALQAAMAAVGAGGGPLPAAALPAGYAVADVGVAIRRPATDVATARPAVVSFDLDLTATPPGTRLLLLALVAAGPGTPAPVGAGLRDVVQGSPQVSARSIEVVAP